ncbi:MAG: hypothetical protein J7647_10010 [Cyanobacteria bacterium SBLK]|nr:hypothetical protein [Cyanobacteria bacterium SBLK]
MMLVVLKPWRIGTVFAIALLGWGLGVSIQSTPVRAQSDAERELLQEVLPLGSNVLAAIRRAPYSQVFSVILEDGATGYGVKDRDFSAKYNDVGFYSLWGDVPEQNLLQVAVFYCFRNPDLTDTELEKVILMAGDRSLVTLVERAIATPTQIVEVVPERYEPIFYTDPFGDRDWGYIYDRWGRDRHVSTIRVPAVKCSMGGSRFDLLPVKEAIAQLPEQTLDVQLIFSNGLVENWRLGRKTVQQLKNLPTLRR